MRISLVSLLVLVGLFLTLVLSIQAHFLEGSPEAIRAEEAASRLPKMFLLPDSIFYFLKVIKEAAQNLFIFDLREKITFQVGIANKRLAEMVNLIHKNQDPYIKKALQREGDVLRKITDLMTKAKEKGVEIQGLKIKHKQLLDDYEIVLLNMEDDIPQEAKNTHRHILDIIDQNRDHMKYEPGYETEEVPGQPFEQEQHEEEEHAH